MKKVCFALFILLWLLITVQIILLVNNLKVLVDLLDTFKDADEKEKYRVIDVIRSDLFLITLERLLICIIAIVSCIACVVIMHRKIRNSIQHEIKDYDYAEEANTPTSQGEQYAEVVKQEIPTSIPEPQPIKTKPAKEIPTQATAPDMSDLKSFVEAALAKQGFSFQSIDIASKYAADFFGTLNGKKIAVRCAPTDAKTLRLEIIKTETSKITHRADEAWLVSVKPFSDDEITYATNRVTLVDAKTL
jgi:hypothetical protein